MIKKFCDVCDKEVPPPQVLFQILIKDNISGLTYDCFDICFEHRESFKDLLKKFKESNPRRDWGEGRWGMKRKRFKPIEPEEPSNVPGTIVHGSESSLIPIVFALMVLAIFLLFKNH